VESVAADRQLDRDQVSDQALSPAVDPPERRRPARLLLGVFIVLVLVGGWWLIRGGRPDAAPVAEPPASETAAAPSPVAAPSPAVAPPAPAPTGAAPEAPPPTPEGPAAATAPSDAGEELRPSHPITPTHMRIQRENNLLGSMNGAMDVEDGAGLRNLLDQYRQEYPDDPNQLQEGYGVIADCLQHPGPTATAAGHRYFDRERGSILRRFVARHCHFDLP
jgi:pyruvate/2-oxoglutarate dehydrogenase complex dihydrolipoamide acyltransferase (E2) component